MRAAAQSKGSLKLAGDAAHSCPAERFSNVCIVSGWYLYKYFGSVVPGIVCIIRGGTPDRRDILAANHTDGTRRSV